MGNSINQFENYCLYFSANSLARKITEMAEQAFAPLNLPPSYGYLLMVIIDEPGLAQNEIAKRMRLKPSTITRFLDKLCKNGFVSREQKGRTVYVHPTKAGLLAKDQIQEALGRLHKEYASILGEELSDELTQKIFEANTILENTEK